MITKIQEYKKKECDYKNMNMMTKKEYEYKTESGLQKNMIIKNKYDYKK